MSSVKSGVPLPSQEKHDAISKDNNGTEGKKSTTPSAEIALKKESQGTEKPSSLSKAEDAKVEKAASSTGPTKLPTSVNGNPSPAAATDGAKAPAATPTKDSSTSITANNSTNPTPTPAAVPVTTESAENGSTAAAVSKQSTSDPKPDAGATPAKKERVENPAPKPAVATSAAVVTAKQPQQHAHSKPHTQLQQRQQQHRYSVPSRQNQEEAVFKMVQNIFKLLENRGPLTMAQLEYNLPILIFGPTSSAQTINATSSKSNAAVSRDPPTGDSSREGNIVTAKENTDPKTPTNRTSLCEEKLIPGNMVPDIVELLVTLGLIQQQTDDDDTRSPRGATQQQHAESTKSQPRFAVHFGKPKQFLVTPTNILSEIAKAQTEIQLSRQRQDLLKEALSMGDQQAAERVKHIVLQHPQVVDDPVYVTALRNLHVDGMLMAGASANTNAGSSNTSSSSTGKDGSGKSKVGAGGSGKKVAGGKRRQNSGGSGGGGDTPAKRKRQRLKKEIPGRIGDADSGSGKKAITSSSGSSGARSNPTTRGTLPSGQSKRVTSSRAAAASNPSSLTPPVPAVAAASSTHSKNT